jgi:hypothetical protein
MNKTETNKHVSRYYKISVNFGLFYYYYNSKTFRLRKGISPYLLSFLYSLLNLFTGFLGIPPSWHEHLARAGKNKSSEPIIRSKSQLDLIPF